jgi:predicted nucleic acid-binding protein
LKTVLFDTNIILDALASRKPYNREAEQLFLLVAKEQITGFITANSVTDIYYLIRKNLSENDARKAIRNLLLLFEIVDITKNDCEIAIDIDNSDYEDAILLVCANKSKIETIVTRDKEFLNYQDFNIVKPNILLSEFNSSDNYE